MLCAEAERLLNLLKDFCLIHSQTVFSLIFLLKCLRMRLTEAVPPSHAF